MPFSPLKQPGEFLTSVVNGGLRAVSERWKAFLGYTTVATPLDETVAPPATSGTLIEGSALQTVIKERLQNQITIGDPTGKSMVEYVMVEGIAATRTVSFPTTGTALSTLSYLDVQAEQQATGVGFSELARTAVPSYPTKQGQEYIGQYNFIAGYTETTAANGTAIGNNLTTVTPKDFLHFNVKTEVVPTAALEAFVLAYPTTDRIYIPEELTGLTVVWNTMNGAGNYSENGTGSAFGSYAHVSIEARGRGQGSAGVLGEIFPTITHYWPHSVPVIDYFFFLPDNFSQGDLLTKLQTLSGSAVSLWPNFTLGSETLLVFGQKITLTAECKATCDVSVIESASSEAASEGTSAGSGSSTDTNQTVRVTTLPPTVHGVIDVIGSVVAAVEAQAVASAVVASGTNFPGARAQPETLFDAAVGQVYPTSLPATNPAAIPKTGLYLFTTDAQPYRWGYSTIRCRILNAGMFALGPLPQITNFDFNVLTGANFVGAVPQITTVGFAGLSGANFVTTLPQITTADFTGLTGASFVTGSAGLAFTLPNQGGDVFGVWFNTGGETVPTISGATAYIEVDVVSGDTSGQLATKLATALAVQSANWSVVAALNVVTFTSTARGVQPNAVDVNSGVAITITQPGSTGNPGLAFKLPSASNGIFAIWFNTGTETQPSVSGAGTYVEINIRPTETPTSISAILAEAFGSSAIWYVSALGKTTTFNSVAYATQSNATDVDSGVALTVVQSGTATGQGKAFIMPKPTTGAYAIWFNTGTETQPSLGTFTYVEIDIAATAQGSAIANALVAAAASLTEWSLTISNFNPKTVSFLSAATGVQPLAYDINSGVLITIQQQGR